MLKRSCARGALIIAAALAANALAVNAAVPAGFPFHNGDRVVFLGDSITEQRLYTTYLETYLLTRFPSWNLQFRNAGWGGDTSWLRQRGLPPDQALKRDVLDLHPTVVTIDFSMNDASYGAFRPDLYTQHVHGEQDIVHQLKAAGVLPIVLTVSPVEKHEPGDDMLGYNQVLEQFAAGDQMVAHDANVPFADQFHPFVAAINRLRAIDPNTRLSGDVVHPGKAGHLLMADFILTGLNAPPLVSSVVIDAAKSRVTHTDGAQVTDLMRQNGGISFHRLDNALVFPIENAARPALQLVPVADNLDRYLLTVTHLAPGDYMVNVDGTPVSRYSASELSNGVNLSYYGSPLTAQGSQILDLVYQKNNDYFDLWRNVQLKTDAQVPDKAAKEADLNAKILDLEKQINALRQPRNYEISVTPVAPMKAPPVTP